MTIAAFAGGGSDPPTPARRRVSPRRRARPRAQVFANGCGCCHRSRHGSSGPIGPDLGALAARQASRLRDRAIVLPNSRGPRLRPRHDARGLRPADRAHTTSIPWSTSSSRRGSLRRGDRPRGPSASPTSRPRRASTQPSSTRSAPSARRRRRLPRVGRLLDRRRRPARHDAACTSRFFAPSHELVDAFHRAGVEAGLRGRRRARPAPAVPRGLLRRASCATPTATASRPSTPASSAAAGDIDHLWLRTARRRGHQGASTIVAPATSIGVRTTPDHVQIVSRRRLVLATSRASRPPSTSTSPSASPRTSSVDAFHDGRDRGGLHGQRRARRARRLPPRLLRGVRARSRRPQHRGRRSQPLKQRAPRGDLLRR